MFVLGNNGELKNVLVTLEGVKKGKEWSLQPAILDNQKCVFVPHIQVVKGGSKLIAKNSDPLLHTAHLSQLSTQLKDISAITKTMAKMPEMAGGHTHGGKSLWNLHLPKQGSTQEKSLPSSGIVGVMCEAHPWMLGYIILMDHPYWAITDSNGNFKITDIPAGTYKVILWHEILGKKKALVTINPGTASQLSFEF